MTFLNAYDQTPEMLIPFIARQRAIQGPQETIGHGVLYIVHDLRLAGLLKLDTRITVASTMRELDRALSNSNVFSILIPEGAAITISHVRQTLEVLATKKAVFWTDL